VGQVFNLPSARKTPQKQINASSSRPYSPKHARGEPKVGQVFNLPSARKTASKSKTAPSLPSLAPSTREGRAKSGAGFQPAQRKKNRPKSKSTSPPPVPRPKHARGEPKVGQVFNLPSARKTVPKANQRLRLPSLSKPAEWSRTAKSIKSRAPKPKTSSDHGSAKTPAQTPIRRETATPRKSYRPRPKLAWGEGGARGSNQRDPTNTSHPNRLSRRAGNIYIESRSNTTDHRSKCSPSMKTQWLGP